MAPQVWLITGTSSGFGAALVHSLLACGDKVIATARTLSKIADLKQAGAATLQLDVTSSPSDLDKIAQDAISTYGKIDVLVNNAGYCHFGTFEDATYVLDYLSHQHILTASQTTRLAITAQHQSVWRYQCVARFPSTLSSQQCWNNSLHWFGGGIWWSTASFSVLCFQVRSYRFVHCHFIKSDATANYA